MLHKKIKDLVHGWESDGALAEEFRVFESILEQRNITRENIEWCFHKILPVCGLAALQSAEELPSLEEVQEILQQKLEDPISVIEMSWRLLHLKDHPNELITDVLRNLDNEVWKNEGE